MNLLFVSHCYPWPLQSGTARRVFHLATGFAARHRVTLVALHRFSEPPEAGFPAHEGMRVIPVVDREVDRRIHECTRAQHLRALFGSRFPLGVSLWRSPELQRLLGELKRAEAFDVVWSERSF